MKYEKPRIANSGNAFTVIKGQMSKALAPADNTTSQVISTPSAYEADE
jgi:hypothetical protein